MRHKLQLLAIAVVFTLIGFCTVYLIPSADAQGVPTYGTFPYDVGIVSSTADQDILAAPGSNKRWVVTGIAWNVLVEEANATVTVEDKANTAVNITEFAPEVQGWGMYIDFGAGIPCTTNSGVQVDLSGSTADVWVAVNAYQEYVQ